MVDVAGARVVAVLTRAPSAPGKTRLFDALGCAPDPRLLTALLLDTLDGAAAADVVRVVFVTPPSRCGEVASIVAPDIRVIPQTEGTLGDRMRHVFASLVAAGARAVAVIGSDLPEIDPSIVAQAFDVLEGDHEALVLGPAADGGYYLIAATRLPDVFDGIAWGTAAVLTETVDAAARSGRRVALLPTLADVDTPQDLARVVNRLPESRTARWNRDGRA
jgi:uncharacterized protein